MHLTNDKLETLLAGTLEPAEARALGAHLDAVCARCDALLAAADPALDALADHALTAGARYGPEEQGNDLEYARIQRALRAPAPRRRAWVPAAAAAALLVAGGLGLQAAWERGRDDGWDGVKGVAPAASAAAIPLRLSAVAVIAEPTPAQRIWRVASGDEVPASAALQLRVELGKPADLAIARIGPDGAVDLFWHEQAPLAGSIPVTMGGRPAAYPLSTAVGRQRFVVLASAERLTDERLRAAIAAAAGEGRGSGAHPGTEGIFADVITLTVR